LALDQLGTWNRWEPFSFLPPTEADVMVNQSLMDVLVVGWMLANSSGYDFHVKMTP
jgi:hypothetical protein